MRWRDELPDHALRLCVAQLIAFAAVLAITACGDGTGEPLTKDTAAPNASWASDQSITVVPLGDSLIDIDTIARGLEVPWSAAVARDGSIYFTERNGRVRVIRGDTLETQPVAQLEIRYFDPGWKPESGLTGIAITPDFDSRGSVPSDAMFLLATYEKGRGNVVQQLLGKVANRIKDKFDIPIWEFENRLVRIRSDTSIRVERVIDADMPTLHYHAGGFLHLGPDGRLYFSVGDGTYPKVAQNPRVLAGKILRLNIDGTVPSDNPVAGSPVFASGLRNSQGLAWHVESGTMFVVDHGPTGLSRESHRVGNDELNVLVPGGNYGWPVEGGEWGPGKLQQPIRVWRQSIAPSGIVSLPTGDANRAELVISSLGQMSLRWLSLTRSDQIWQVSSERELVRGQFGRLRMLYGYPDGTFLVGTSNRDGRGSRKELDDLILRFRLKTTG